MIEPDPRQSVLSVIEDLRAAMLAVADTFMTETRIAPALDAVLAGDARVAALVAAFDVSAARRRLLASLDRYEALRRDARVAIWKAMLAEGCSVGEVGRIFGVSRQLVHRQITDHDRRIE